MPPTNIDESTNAGSIASRVPKYDELCRSVLLAVDDGEIHEKDDLYDKVAYIEGITSDMRSVMLESGSCPIFEDRVNWARTYLKAAGLVDYPARDRTQITAEGKRVLSDSAITLNDYLSRHEAFKAFKSRFNSADAESGPNRLTLIPPRTTYTTRSIQDNFEEISVALTNAEKRFRKEYDNALDISDFGEARRVSSEAQRNILRIRDWRDKVKAIADEIGSFRVKIIPAADEPVSPPDTLPAEQTSSARAPKSMTLFGKTYDVKNWNEVYIKVCELMLLHKPYIAATFDIDTDLNSERQRNFSFIKSDIKSGHKRLPNGLWTDMKQGANDTLSFCGKIIAKCGFSPESLTVMLWED